MADKIGGMQTLATRGGRSSGSTWSAFLVAAFVVLGLCGWFATYAAQLPFQRLDYAERRLDLALAAPGGAARLDALRDALGADGAGAFDTQGDLAHRVAVAREVLRRHFTAQAADIALRLRIVLAVFTFAASLFGVMVASVLRRAPG